MGVMDFLFGSDALKKAAGTKSSDKPSPSRGDAGLDMGRLAQESADRQKSQASMDKPSKSTSPLSTTMTPLGASKKADKK